MWLFYSGHSVRDREVDEGLFYSVRDREVMMWLFYSVRDR